jgi:hypothetical protein
LTTEINLRSWRGFARCLATIRKKAGEQLLFRGHADSRWTLQTTLERRGHLNMPVHQFFRMVGNAHPRVQSFTERRFEIPTYPELLKLLDDYDKFSLEVSFGRFPMYEFLIYLRHHGFPSPLLDWTESPYVAAFFAFMDERPNVKKRSIHVWKESRITSHGTGRPQMKTCGPYVTAHRRHVVQQCEYSLCVTYVPGDKEWRFTSQEEGLSQDDHEFWKINIPSTERPSVLKNLDEFNLNAYSLFGSEDSLMHSLATRDMDFAGADFAPPSSPRPKTRRSRKKQPGH